MDKIPDIANTSADYRWHRFYSHDESTIPVANFETDWGYWSAVIAEKSNGERIHCAFDFMSGFFVDSNGEDIGEVVAYQYATSRPPVEQLKPHNW